METQRENPAACTRPQQWLLLGTLALGVFSRYAISECVGEWGYSVFWLLCLGLFLYLNWPRAKGNKTGWALLVPAVVMSVRWIWISEEHALYLLTALAIPLLFMLYAVTVTRDVPVKREGEAVKGIFRGFFVQPFTAIPRFFGAVKSLFSGENGGSARRVGIGLAIGLPLTVGVLALLSSADVLMERFIGGWIERLNLYDVVGHVLFVPAVAVPFYSFLYNTAFEPLKPLGDPVPATWPRATLLVVIGLLLAVYALFIGMQFGYLFGGALPEEFTYAEYARRGFGELMAVAVINFSVLGLSVRFGKPDRVLTASLWALLTATALLLASAIVRLGLYIGAYRLTFNRILPMWFMVYLCGAVVVSGVRLAKEKTPALRILSLAFVYWYLLLTLPDWDAVISSVNSML